MASNGQSAGQRFQVPRMSWRGWEAMKLCSQKRMSVLCVPNASFADLNFDGNDGNFLTSFTVAAIVLIWLVRP